MTQLLLRLFIRTTDPQKKRSAVGRMSGIVGIICNLLLCLGKLVIGSIAGAVSITADAMNNLSDAASSIVTLVGFKLSESPADDEHPYGHARFEYLSGLAVAAIVVVIGFEMLKTSVQKIISPTPVAFSPWVALVLILSIAVKLWMSLFNRKLGKEINSAPLLATSVDSRNDVISTAVVLTAALIEAWSGLHADGFMGLLVALFILYSGCTLAKETISPLLGEAASPELKALIAEHVSQHPKVLGYHDLMVHDYGPGQRFASIHVEMDRNEDPMLCHEIIDNIERECMEQHRIHLVIHYDPIITDDPVLNHLHQLVDETLLTLDDRLHTHDFRMVEGAGHTNLIFDVALPSDLSGKERYITEQLETVLREREKKTFYAVITFDPATFN